MRAPDLTYRNDGLFVHFYAENQHGVEAWLEIAKQTEGTARIFAIHLAGTLKQLRAAGYRVSVAAPVIETDEELLSVLRDRDTVDAYP